MSWYCSLRPLLFCLEPERAHRLAIKGLASGLMPLPKCPEFPILNTNVLGLNFANPVGMAAGFDKNAEAMAGLLKLGFGFVEVGTVTPKPQSGNPKPRMFRLIDDEAVINRLGFNNEGMEVFKARLRQRPSSGIIGANIGKNKDSADAIEDYLVMLRAVYGLSDYITVNISSPNTPGLRDLQGKAALEQLLSALMSTRAQLAKEQSKTIPILLKIAPDMGQEQREDIAEVVLAHKIDGIIVSNTTVGREGLRSPLAKEQGGLSGKPLFALSTEALRQMYRLTGGKIPLVGVGGIASGRDAYEKIRAGASLVQLYSALVYQGPALVGRIISELAYHLELDGFSHISKAVGVGVK